MALLLEICTGSVDDCIAAEQGGADRIELNGALSLGGLTPSLGTIRETVCAVRLPVIVMIRPRDGGFCYSDAAFRTMQRDIDAALEAGAAGIAFGILCEDGRMDKDRTRQLITRARGAHTVLHRAFDLTPDPFQALADAIECGFTRILTSGQEATALAGAPLIGALRDRAADRIEILPGSGIRPGNVDGLIRNTGCTQVHCSLSGLTRDTSGTGLDFRNLAGMTPDTYTATDMAQVGAMRSALDRIV
ncbi:copper homeostasis protein CutC [bacterium]|nr:copper homeostasis protein CutC [bacterium]